MNNKDESTYGELEPLFRKAQKKLMAKKWVKVNSTKSISKPTITYIEKIINTPEVKQRCLDYAMYVCIYGTDSGFKWDKGTK
jgi:hypothetical protein